MAYFMSHVMLNSVGTVYTTVLPNMKPVRGCVYGILPLLFFHGLWNYVEWSKYLGMDFGYPYFCLKFIIFFNCIPDLYYDTIASWFCRTSCSDLQITRTGELHLANRSLQLR